MKEEEYKALIEKKGAHTFVVVMSTEMARRVTLHDLWMRTIIAFLGTIAVAAMAWLAKPGEDLGIATPPRSGQRIESASQRIEPGRRRSGPRNRNPLNIIRGLAQLISKQQSASPETQAKSARSSTRPTASPPN